MIIGTFKQENGVITGTIPGPYPSSCREFHSG
jgi:hypothetical protein